ncbi:MAG: Hsp20/alpha crystallin family protein [Bacteroidetes bacterium]|nr:Hsp20/alpha crystallin family protein [Bacteroidota bacterium]
MLPMITKRSFRPFFMPGIFEDNFFPTVSGSTNITKPAVNIREDEKKYSLELAVPGIDKKDLKIEINEDILTISMEQKQENEEETSGYKRREFSYASFCRSFYLPEDTNRDKIEASYKDGVLTVDLHKTEEKAKLSKVVKIS